jgi:hypothetical protein
VECELCENVVKIGSSCVKFEKLSFLMGFELQVKVNVMRAICLDRKFENYRMICSLTKGGL